MHVLGGGFIRVGLEHIRETQACFSGEVRGLMTFLMSQSDVNSRDCKENKKEEVYANARIWKVSPTVPSRTDTKKTRCPKRSLNDIIGVDFMSCQTSVLKTQGNPYPFGKVRRWMPWAFVTLALEVEWSKPLSGSVVWLTGPLARMNPQNLFTSAKREKMISFVLLFVESLSRVPSTHTEPFTAWNSISRPSCTLFWPKQAPALMCTWPPIWTCN